MKNSQRVLLLALACLVGIVVIIAGLGGWGLAHVEPQAFAEDASSATNRNGEIVRTYDLKDFRRIESQGEWRIKLRRGAGWEVRVSYPEDLEGRLNVRVDGDRLTLGYAPQNRGVWNWGHRRAVEAEIVMPELAEVELSGAAELDFSGFAGGRLALTVSGAAEVDGGDGLYDALALSVSGAGDVDLRGMKFTDARVDIAGAGDVTLRMDGGVLSGELAGAGKITYFGEVRDQRVDISGFGKVTHGN